MKTLFIDTSSFLNVSLIIDDKVYRRDIDHLLNEHSK